MYNEQVKELIKILYKNLIAEKKQGSLRYSINDPLKRACYLTGISRSSIKRWVKQDLSSTPLKQTKTQFGNLDQFDVDIVLRKLHQSFDKKQPISTRKLQKVLEEENQLNVAKTTIWKILKRNGFSFRRTNGN